MGTSCSLAVSFRRLSGAVSTHTTHCGRGGETGPTQARRGLDPHFPRRCLRSAAESISLGACVGMEAMLVPDGSDSNSAEDGSWKVFIWWKVLPKNRVLGLDITQLVDEKC